MIEIPENTARKVAHGNAKLGDVIRLNGIPFTVIDFTKFGLHMESPGKRRISISYDTLIMVEARYAEVA